MSYPLCARCGGYVVEGIRLTSDDGQTIYYHEHCYGKKEIPRIRVLGIKNKNGEMEYVVNKHYIEKLSREREGFELHKSEVVIKNE